MIKIVCVGKIKEAYLREAINDYTRRLLKYNKLKIIEVEEETIDDKEKLLQRESDKILKNIDSGDYVITLEIEGDTLSSKELANKIDRLFAEGKSNVVFIIGGSSGLSDLVKKRSDYHFSFSNLTFPHQLFRLLLLEQLYRSYKIINNESYHK